MKRLSWMGQRPLWLFLLVGFTARHATAESSGSPTVTQTPVFHSISVENFVLEYDAIGTPKQKHFSELAVATTDFIFLKLYDFYDDNFVGFDINHIEEISRYEVQFHGEATFSDDGPSKNSINMHIKSIFAVGPAYLGYIRDTLDESNPFATSSVVEYVDIDYEDEVETRDRVDPDYEHEMNENAKIKENDIDDWINEPKAAPPVKSDTQKKTSNLIYALAYSFAMLASALLTIVVLICYQHLKLRRELNKLDDGSMSAAFAKAHTIASTVSDITPPSPKSPRAYSDMNRRDDKDGGGERARLMVEETLDWPDGPFEPVSPDDPRLQDISTSDDTTMESLILNI